MGNTIPLISSDICSEKSSPKSEVQDGVIGRSVSTVFVYAVCKECVEISYFDFDLNNTVVL